MRQCWQAWASWGEKQRAYQNPERIHYDIQEALFTSPSRRSFYKTPKNLFTLFHCHRGANGSVPTGNISSRVCSQAQNWCWERPNKRTVLMWRFITPGDSLASNRKHTTFGVGSDWREILHQPQTVLVAFKQGTCPNLGLRKRWGSDHI